MKLLLAWFVLLTACGSTGAPAALPSQPRPLVHRFEHAEQWAKEFDDPRREAWQKPVEVVGAMRVEPGMTVADIGAGTGYFEPYLSRAVGASGAVLAVDIEPDMVRYLGERAAREGLHGVRPILADVDDPKLPTGGVDRILIVDTWHHVPDHATYLAKLRHALTSRGTITIVEFTLDSPYGPPPHHRIAEGAVLAEATSAGLSAEPVAVSLPYQYVVVAH